MGRDHKVELFTTTEAKTDLEIVFGILVVMFSFLAYQRKQ
jgi:hypothetical protein